MRILDWWMDCWALCCVSKPAAPIRPARAREVGTGARRRRRAPFREETTMHGKSEPLKVAIIMRTYQHTQPATTIVIALSVIALLELIFGIALYRPLLIVAVIF